MQSNVNTGGIGGGHWAQAPPNRGWASKFSRTLDTEVNSFSEKNSKFDAIRYQILRPKCSKFYFRWGSATAALPRTLQRLAVFKGPTSKGKRGEETGERKGKGGERERRGQALKYFGLEPPL